MSSNFPGFESESLPSNQGSAYQDLIHRDPGPSLREWVVAALLLCVTILTTTLAGMFYDSGIDFLTAFRIFIVKPSLILRGLPFSIPLISILLAHELGHFLTCRYYGMRCTPPFFLPAPISITGTFGAFIKIKSQFRNRRVLFDIGVAGPLAGFLLALPTLWIGISWSRLLPKGSFTTGALIYGEPLIFRILGKLILGYSADKQDMLAHPIAMAAWVGLLATSLNLLPIWQLDGGHIAYAMLGSLRHKRLSILSNVGLILVSFLQWRTPSYLLFGMLLLIIGARVRFYHPPTLSEGEELGPERKFIGVLALLILVLSFTPVPITIT